MRTGILGAMAVMTACRPSPTSERTAEPVKSITVVPLATSAPIVVVSTPSARPSGSGNSEPDSPEVAFSLAAYEGDRLDFCVDMRMRFDNQIDALNFRADAKAKILNKLPKDMTVLASTCAGGFKDRQVLATCTTEQKAGAGTLTAVERHYLFDTSLADDKRMRQCLGDHGKWDALAHDSEEFKKEERDAHVRDAQDFVKKHGGG
jgi:hypothetical protein